jgi:tRNA nucleotidyltransferase (CCA-adding enzyme)
MMEKHPRLFFDTLLECDVLHKVFPEIYRLLSALESLRWHPEGNAYEHTMLVLTQSALFDLPIEMRMAALTHDFGKGLTPLDKLPQHFGHDVKGVRVVDEFCMKNKVPNKIKNVCMTIAEFHMNMHKLKELTGKTYVKMFQQLNNRDGVNVLYWIGVCDERGRLGSENADYSDKVLFIDKYNAFLTVKFDNVFPDGETNPEKIKQGLHRARVHAIDAVK